MTVFTLQYQSTFNFLQSCCLSDHFRKYIKTTASIYLVGIFCSGKKIIKGSRNSWESHTEDHARRIDGWMSAIETKDRKHCMQSLCAFTLYFYFSGPSTWELDWWWMPGGYTCTCPSRYWRAPILCYLSTRTHFKLYKIHCIAIRVPCSMILWVCIVIWF